MAISIVGLSEDEREAIHPRIEFALRIVAGLNLSITKTTANLVWLSLDVLPYKKSQPEVLSSTAIFLTAVAIGQAAAQPNAENSDEELVQLGDWVSSLSADTLDALDRLADDFFTERPRFGPEVLGRFTPHTKIDKVTLGPGLERVLTAASDGTLIGLQELLMRLIDDGDTGIAGRLTRAGLGRVRDSLLVRDTRALRRHAGMFREAEDDELALGVSKYAAAVATVLRAAKGEFTFALFGAWGSGKTTLVKLLRPLLVDPVLYRRMAGFTGTSEAHAHRHYRVVLHNAWKYRAPPEAWVYAYKSLADEARKSFGPFGRLLLSVRTSVYRSGPWPIVSALLILALLAIPLATKFQLAMLFISLVGFSTALYLGAVTTGVSGRVRALFAKHFRLSSTEDRLGMLALVGDDMRSLLAAWTRSDVDGKPSRGPVFLSGSLVIATGIVWLVGLLGWGSQQLGAKLSELLSAIIPESWQSALAPLFSDAPGSPGFGAWLVFALWVLLACLLLVAPWWAERGRPHRVLMVIDDLDRCTASEMLGVIEGMKLLIDEPTVNSRLQLLMLVDERVLNHAIAKGYATLIRERAAAKMAAARPADTDPSACERAARHEIVVEQYEKLFACHLRMAPLSEADIQDVVESLAGREQRAAESAVVSSTDERQPEPELPAPRENSLEDIAMQLPQSQVPADQHGGGGAAIAESPTEIPSAEPALEPLFDDTDVRFTREEIDDLRREVPSYFSTIDRNPSPRAIRILLFKIQLYRLLLQLRYPNLVQRTAIRPILDAFRLANETQATEGARILIARQVV